MWKKSKGWLLALGTVMVLSIGLTGCGKKDKGDEKEASTEVVEEKIEEKSYLSVDTSVAYSAGNDSAWSYGNQRKEFPDGEACYVRISSTAITSGKFGKGKNTEISVTYRFIGTDSCPVSISDGNAKSLSTDEANTTEFTETLYAASAKKADESVTIFRYMPKDAESIKLEVIYDDRIAEKYDVVNTIYFTDNTSED